MNPNFTRSTLSLLILFCLAALPAAALAAIPKAPAILTAKAASGMQINLSWADQSKDETGFEVEQSTDGNKFSKIADLPANAVSYQSKSLKPATRYWYRVRAKNASGTSAYSNVANATTQQVAPDAPAGLVATALSTSQINLKWTDNADNETGYLVERSLNGITFVKIADLAANVTTYENTGLAAATDYHYRVQAVNAVGTSQYSNTARAKTMNIPAPDAPLNLLAVPTALDLVRLRWEPPHGNAAEIVIERAKGEGSFVQIAKVAATVLQYEDKSALEPVDYLYRIKAVNAGGESPYSRIALVRAASIITAVETPLDQYSIYVTDRTLVARLHRPVEVKLAVYDLMGRLRRAGQFRQEGRVQLDALPAGVYVVVTDTGKEEISRRILLY